MDIEGLRHQREEWSKTQYKKRSEEVHRFVQRLGKLNSNQINGLGLPKDFTEELFEAQSLKAPVARNRQLKQAAAILREHLIWGSDEAASQYERIGQGKTGLRGVISSVTLDTFDE